MPRPDTINQAERLTVREVADLERVSQEKVLAWIGTGELRAINVASTHGCSPRWRIARDDLALFEQRRAALSMVQFAQIQQRPHRVAAGLRQQNRCSS
jgi:excisionase family DNA binding protein